MWSMKNKKPKKVIEVSVSTIILVCITLVGLTGVGFLFQTQQTQATVYAPSGFYQATTTATAVSN